jgi:hypothetical protein
MATKSMPCTVNSGMVSFNATIKKFGSKGEKTGWSYIEVPAKVAAQLMPGMKRSFRVKGKLDDHPIAGVALIPMGEGNFILGVNARIRKATRKVHGHKLAVKLELDHDELKPPAEFIECLNDEPEALQFFNSLTPGHRNYFSKWIGDAKTIETKTKRIAASVDGLKKHFDFGQMLRDLKSRKVS